jgi:secreted PhoX family phosphatase
MSDGLVVPGFPDGMGAFERNGKVLLVRNHELESKGDQGTAERYRILGPYGKKNELLSRVDRESLYDPGVDERYPSIGGTTTLVLDRDTGKKEAEFLSLAGTERNCAGGVTPWGTWITCEESTETAGNEYVEDHGYPFEVEPTLEPGLQSPKAYKDMGRFRREAIAVDPTTGIVYQTEDLADGIFYRFLPNVRGRLGEGGRLQALAIVGRPGADTRNWEAGSWAPDEGVEILVEWVDLDDVRSPEDDLRYRGRKEGAALFARGEGIWFGHDGCYFACTSGGRERFGQIFKYTPAPSEEKESATGGTLQLFIESTSDDEIRSADNLTLAPWGDLIVCEDRKYDSHVRGVTRSGQVYTVARNAVDGTEFAGACFANGLSTLFVNIQRPGVTLAIDGPWSG